MSYYGKGTKEGILASLETALNTISGIKFVDYQRIYDAGITPDQYPGVFINDIEVRKEQVLKDIVRNTFSVGLVLWVWAREGEDLATKLNTFVENVKDAVMADPYRDSNAYSTRIMTIATDAGSRYPQGLGLMTLEIIYFGDE